MKTYGLIGYPISQSFSKRFFERKFERENIENCTYDLFQLESIEELTDLFTVNPDCAGLNVTIPYKEAVMDFLDELDEEAAEVGAVNTIQIRNGKRIGFNTDIIGLRNSLEPLLLDHHYKGALILGSGGASKSAQYVCEKLDIPFQVISRKVTEGPFSYAGLLEQLPENYYLIINTSPVGMAPLEDYAPQLNYEQMDDRYLLFDMVYNPEKTLFLRLGEAQGAQIKNGLEMLEGQAIASWEIWNRED